MATVSDDFNRADDASSMGADWENTVGTWGILSNQCDRPASDSVARWVGSPLASSDYSVELDCDFWGDGPAVRLDASGDGYGIYISSNAAQLWRIAAGVRTANLGSLNNSASVADRRIRLTCEGTTLTVEDLTFGGTYSTTDATHATGLPGMWAFGGSGIWLDNWTAYDLASGNRRRRLLMGAD